MKRVLLVEDRDDDVLLFKHALESLKETVELDVVEDGEEAVHYLNRAQSTAFASTSEVPDLILLDLRMPRVDGFETLQWIRQQMKLMAVPVVVLSNSNRRDDILKAQCFGANSYIAKTADLSEFSRTLGSVLKYWLEINRPLNESNS